MNIDNLKNKNIHFVECENWHDVYGYEKSQMKEDTINYIEQLQQENKILKENAENNDKVVDKVNWENLLLKKENKQLKDNWNKLKEWLNKHYDYYMNNEDFIGGRLCFTDMKNKMQELQGSDSNV